MNSIMKYLILAVATSFFGVAQATCVIVSEPDGEACTGTNPLGGACAWTPVNGGYICARPAAPSTTVIPKHILRDKVKQVVIQQGVSPAQNDQCANQKKIKNHAACQKAVTLAGEHPAALVTVCSGGYWWTIGWGSPATQGGPCSPEGAIK